MEYSISKAKPTRKNNLVRWSSWKLRVVLLTSIKHLIHTLQHHISDMAFGAADWTFYSESCLIIVLLGVVVSGICLYIYFTNIYPHFDHVAIKRRRPKLLLLILILCIMQMIIGPLVSLLITLHLINYCDNWYSSMITFVTLFGAPTWTMIRLWILYYDIQVLRCVLCVLLCFVLFCFVFVWFFCNWTKMKIKKVKHIQKQRKYKNCMRL